MHGILTSRTRRVILQVILPAARTIPRLFTGRKMQSMFGTAMVLLRAFMRKPLVLISILRPDITMLSGAIRREKA